eukprot:TRINITY_DN48966_c0_g1_i1.p1 TRINITY_DN48966_c0_g1~~TRINITY_DN48966_c0_g1_i1.p1  ORF type:complete len:137 (+),score=11.27 TRINITY_DN48966_c0_g1_i1:52-462(+)
MLCRKDHAQHLNALPPAMPQVLCALTALLGKVVHLCTHAARHASQKALSTWNFNKSHHLRIVLCLLLRLLCLWKQALASPHPGSPQFLVEPSEFRIKLLDLPKHLQLDVTIVFHLPTLPLMVLLTLVLMSRHWLAA